MKFPLLISSAALQLVNADRGEVEDILLKMESVVRTLRDELENAYSARCDSSTLETCANNNFHDCASAFPNPQCGLKFDNKDPLSPCQCGLLWDTNTTTTSLPKPIGENATSYDDALIDSVCYSHLAEQHMSDTFHDDFWAEHELQPASIFFASAEGVFRRIPARQSEKCGWYDPRNRTWYAATTSVPKDVVLLIDRSQSKSSNPLMIAKETASTIINTLAERDRVVVIAFSSDASVLAIGNILTEDNILVEASDENKELLIKAVKSLKADNTSTSNLYNAFNVTFEILRNPTASGKLTRCTTAIMLLTDGHVNEGQSEEETNKIINLVEEQSRTLATNFNTSTILFTYSVGDDADLSLTKRIACGTGGIWQHLGEDKLEGLISALTPYYKLFAMGLANGDHYDYVWWNEPYLWVIDRRMATTVTVPVFDRNVTPYLLVGVAGIGLFMDTLYRIHGENTTNSLLLHWAQKSSIEGCPAIDPTDCQLDALRFLGGGKNATCGVCNITGYDASFVPDICPSNTSLPIDLWDNIENHKFDYSERGCCENFEQLSSESCPSSSETSKTSGSLTRWNIAVVVAIAAVGALFE